MSPGCGTCNEYPMRGITEAHTRNHPPLLSMTRRRRRALSATHCPLARIQNTLHVASWSSMFFHSISLDRRTHVCVRAGKCERNSTQDAAAASHATRLRKRQRELPPWRSVGFRWTSRRQTCPRSTRAKARSRRCRAPKRCRCVAQFFSFYVAHFFVLRWVSSAMDKTDTVTTAPGLLGSPTFV
jgi:hypothetical protein